MENKTGKYFKYAIGEIVLVVIGILIALSINNWNETRKSKIQEIKILKQLKADLDENLKELKMHKRFEDNRATAIDSIFVFLNEKRNTNDSLLKYLAQIKLSLVLNTSNTTYKYIESNGMNVLSNDSLRSLITKIYDYNFPIVEKYTFTQSENIRLKLLPYMQKHFKPAMINSFSSRPLRHSTNPIDMEQLWNSFEFQNLLLEIKFYAEDFKQVLIFSEFGTNKLIHNLETEIKKLEN